MENDNSLDYFLQSRPRPELVALIPNNAQKILEVGCGIGMTGKLLTQGNSKYIVGIDLNSEALAMAAKTGYYNQLIECNLETEPIPSSLQDKYDCILYPDVL